MAELPGGTVTFVFTDIEGSTRLLHTLGPSYEEALATHRSLLREAFSAHDGVEVDTQGDALFYAFARARDALRGAIQGQRALASHPWPEGAELRVRMGIHTGEPTVTQEGYVGSDVHLGARICAVAWGEQILVSDASARLVAQLPDASLRDLGKHSLKDIDDPVRLHQVVAPGLRHDFPPPRTASSHPTNLPPTLPPLVGRAEDLTELVSLLAAADSRVVTLTGPGGVGKTRVALAAGTEALHSFDDGVFFIDLSALADPALVVGAIATALGLRESPGRTLTEFLSDYLAPRHTLLILDNLEHLLDAAADVAALVSSAPSLKVLVTSREPLRIAGEKEFPLPPLALPVSGDELEDILASPAVELFVARAQAVRPGFTVSPEAAPDVARICRRVDGLPLALELAAARVKVLSVAALASRLEASLAALGSGRRDASDRQRTLKGAIAWSYGLLENEEQKLFARLGVFAGGWTLEAAEVVCDRDELSFDVLEGLSSLVDKSLVRQVEGDEDRFSMLETIREFASEKLEESGEAHDIGGAHAEYFRELAEEAEPNLVGENQKEWLDRLERELDNLRAGLQWLVDNDVEQAGRCTVTLRRLWEGRGLARAGYSLSANVLERGEGHLQPILTARLCHAAGSLVGTLGDHETARRFLDRAMSLFAESDDEGGITVTMLELAWLSILGGDYQRAEQLIASATEVAKELGDKALYGRALRLEATVSMERGDHKFSKKRFQQSLAVSRDAGDKGGVASVLLTLGGMYLENEQPAEARELFDQSLRLAQEIGDIDALSRIAVNLGFVSLLQGKVEEAVSWFASSLSGAERTGAKYVTAYGLEGLACAAVSQGRNDDAVRLYAVAEKLRKEIRVPRTTGEDQLYRQYIEQAKRQIGFKKWTNLMIEAESSPRSPMLTELKDMLRSSGAHD
jgi:predicted ATPase/class 3 adenylate cyclase/Tfp pilus assembly protein PilF